MKPDDEKKVEIGREMGLSFMLMLAGIFLAFTEEGARLIGAGMAVFAGVWFYVSLRKLMALRPREPRFGLDDRLDPD